MSNGSLSWSGSASIVGYRIPVQGHTATQQGNNLVIILQQDQAICGIVAGCTSTLVMHPLDLVKAKLQVLTTSQGAGLPTQLIRIARNDGFIGLYRGIGVNLIGNCSSVAFLYIFLYLES
jgi:hypothetical protein